VHPEGPVILTDWVVTYLLLGYVGEREWVEPWA
jgi:hypothetical protein